MGTVSLTISLSLVGALAVLVFRAVRGGQKEISAAVGPIVQMDRARCIC